MIEWKNGSEEKNLHAHDYFYSINGHPTEVGHQRLAAALADYLKSL